MPAPSKDPIPSRPRRPKLLFLVTEDWYFWSHRLPMARAARDAGFDVAVAARMTDHRAAIEAEGFRVHPLSWRRRSRAPAELKAIAEIAALYRRERPDIVHHVALKPVVFGSLAARFAGRPAMVNALTGLGYVFTATSLRARVIRAILSAVLRVLVDRPNGRVVLQNPDDLSLLVGRGISRARARLVPGSGVDIRRFAPLPPPETDAEAGAVTCAVVSRMLTIKGVPVAVAAVREARRQGAPLHLLLAGVPDPESHAAISRADLESWDKDPGITWLGHVADVREVWARAHLAVQPSLGGEGIPKSLLEAAACGRPIVATDVPGCREIVRPGENGDLVPPGDPAALAAALAALAGDAERRRRYGAESRRRVETDLSAEAVGHRIVAIYRELLGAAPRR
ncbi:glycosyltransferase family 4 protein [Roseospira navarrensis]|uniref:Glycosyltransferase n=1 Tax=Roseospira navarrensis TaxID=140058 RepID=A0A7X1ZD59_9PROT|nr:glycosyltransferase family 4 protein [Roseospira navarrensis]MQX36365.1 glycosyltransferase [Roseospira navarrensis]